MKNLLMLLLCSFLFSCSSQQHRACDEAAKTEIFPEKGTIASIDISFEISVEDTKESFNEIAECEYQGGFCPAGEWNEVWYGDQSISYDIDLLNGERLTVWPHSFCINLNEFKKKCASGNCNPAEHFKLRLQLSEKSKNERIEECRINNPDRVTSDTDEFVKCAVPGVDSVTFEKLEQYGYKVENPKIKVRNSRLITRRSSGTKCCTLRPLAERYVENSDGTVTTGGTTTMPDFTIIDYLKINLIPCNPCLANSFLPPYPVRDIQNSYL